MPLLLKYADHFSVSAWEVYSTRSFIVWLVIRILSISDWVMYRIFSVSLWVMASWLHNDRNQTEIVRYKTIILLNQNQMQD
jgi:hypothetical protein